MVRPGIASGGGSSAAEPIGIAQELHQAWLHARNNHAADAAFPLIVEQVEVQETQAPGELEENRLRGLTGTWVWQMTSSKCKERNGYAIFLSWALVEKTSLFVVDE